MVVEHSLQDIDYISFYVDWEELSLELLYELSLGLDRKFASICFIPKDVLGPLGSLTSFKEHKGPEYLFFFVAKLLWGQTYVESTGVKKGLAGTLVFIKV